MESNETAQPVNELDVRLTNLKNAHKQLLQQKASLERDLEVTSINLVKVQGAYEALADYKSFSEPKVPQESATSNEASGEVPELVN
jgi:hypothetical protein